MNDYSERFSRQTILKGFGIESQTKLQKSSVLIIGLGGLGCPIVEYLASMGVGRLGIADDDTVSMSNLNRQFIFGEKEIGKKKTEIVAENIFRKHTGIQIEKYSERWNHQKCIDFFPEYDVIVDATDNFATRYMINDACFLQSKPLVYGAVSEFEGQVAVFNVELDNGELSCNYRDLFPVPPQQFEIQNCSERGVIGVLPGIIGCMQALEVVKIITGVGKPLINKILTFNGMTQDSFLVEFDKNPESFTMIPKDVNDFLKTDYQIQCGIHSSHDINWSEAITLVKDKKAILVDVREYHELPRIQEIDHLAIPISELPKNLLTLQNENIIFVCQSGKRSLTAIEILQREGIHTNMFSVKGGIQSNL